MKTLNECTVGFIGGGNMAEAIIRGLVGKDVVPKQRLLVSDPAESRRTFFSATLGVAATDDNARVVRESDAVVLAVKPQFMAEALAPVGNAFREGQLVISIAAGIRTDRIDSWCGGKPTIVRVMPNTPALVGKGVSALCPGPRADAAAVEAAMTLFRSVGSALAVTEDDMDAVTALSGSGPAYVFYWMEAMLKAAADAGFDAATARELVYGTFDGAVALAQASADDPSVLRGRVTSKGGTTAAAIASMDASGIADAVVRAVEAAAARSRELSGM